MALSRSLPTIMDADRSDGAGDSVRAPSPLERPEVRIFLVAIVAIASLCLADTRPEQVMDRVLLVWILVCFGGEVLWFRTSAYDGTLSLALTLDIAAIVCLPPSAARLVVAASTLLAGIYPQRRPWYRILFNVAQSTVATTAAAAAFAAVAHAGGVSESRHIPVLGLTTAGLVFYGVNTFLVATVQALSHRRSPLEVWRDSYAAPLEMASTAGQLTLALFVILAYRVAGPATLLAVFPILLALWFGARTPSTIPPPPAPTLPIAG